MGPKSVKRKLSTILSADVQGYSRLIGDDEIASIKELTEYRKTMASLVIQIEILPKPIKINRIQL